MRPTTAPRRTAPRPRSSPRDAAGRRAVLAAGLLAALLAAAPAAPAAEMAPLGTGGLPPVHGQEAARYSDRTLTLAIEIDRDAARLLAFTVKDRPFVRPLALAPVRPYREGEEVQAEIVLLGPKDARYTQRLDAGPICLTHAAIEAPHVQGDRIRVHRDTLIAEVPERAGFDRIEIAIHEEAAGSSGRRVLAVDTLDAARFTPAGGKERYDGLLFAGPASTEAGSGILTAGTVHWPEEYGDPDLYKVYGEAAEADRRINVVIVPDGYTYAEKGLMESHAAAMVAHYRAKTPYAEHDPFFNYTLVYAFSTESGTDQCDCSIVRDTAMGTGFPGNSGYPCGHSENRCLYYGWSCDNAVTSHLVAAELRAPAHDTTVVMVNTSRYGGCGGARAVYSAGNSAGVEVSVHELGHSLANLADEYAYDPLCGTYASEINTSRNSVNGAWPEWIPTIGAPSEGAQYYQYCLYRPEFTCEMRALNAPFCRVCNQHWGRTIFGHYRVSPTAPIASLSPAAAVQTYTGVSNLFSITTRLGLGTTNALTWKLQGPGYPAPTVVATGVQSHTRAFAAAGDYTLTCEVAADTNFILPPKYGANVDVASWSVYAVNANVDADGDGVTPAQGDCDDGRAAVYPGAPALCDGLLNDCLAAGWPAPPATEVDDDLDTYFECEGDCNDADPQVHPGITEIGCDGVDNDCNAATSDLRDADGDAFACDADCDDADPATFPGAPEANDGKDNQCGGGEAGFGLVDEISGTLGFFDGNDPTRLCWPAQAGALHYKVVRSASRSHAAACLGAPASAACWSDPEAPPSKAVFYYLARSLRPLAGSLGQSSGGSERSGLCGTEGACRNGLDDDGDGRADCADPDCLASIPCPAVSFPFTDTAGDDIAADALATFFEALDAVPSDHIRLSETIDPGAIDFEWCSPRADFHRDRYLALAPGTGIVPSQGWERWHRERYASWTGPVTDPFDNLFGDDCMGPMSWCPEFNFGGRGILLGPAEAGICEAADFGRGCNEGMGVTLTIGTSRAAACGF